MNLLVDLIAVFSGFCGSKLHCLFSLVEKVEKGAGDSPKANEAGALQF